MQQFLPPSTPPVKTITSNGDIVKVVSGPPLDYSFKELSNVSEIEQEEPRSGMKRSPSEPRHVSGATSPGAGESQGVGQSTSGAHATSGIVVKSALMPKQRCIIKTLTRSLKLDNNRLESVKGLAEALEFAISSPTVAIEWLDLSFNKLCTVEPDMLMFMNLKALYLHGNIIRSMSCVRKLAKLPKLMSLTLIGNPIGDSKSYRLYAIGALPRLKSLDHSTITEDERLTAEAWYRDYQKRQQEIRKKQEERKAIAEMEG